MKDQLHSQKVSHQKAQHPEVHSQKPSHILEFKIQDMLLTGTDEMFIADTLIREWSSNTYNDLQSHTVCQFLIQCGFYASLCNQIAQRVLKRQEVPLQDVAYILKKFDTYIDQESVDLLFQGLEESCQNELLAFMSHDEDLLNESIENNWRGHLKKIQKHLIEKWRGVSKTEKKPPKKTERKTEKKQTYIKHTHSLDTSQSQEASDQITTSQAILEEAEYKDTPSESHFVPSVKSQEEFLINRIFQQVESEFQETLSKAQKEIIPSILKQAQQIPHLAYDLAVSLFVMGAYQEALNVLNQYESRCHDLSMTSLKSIDFLKLEVYSAHKCYLELLEHIDNLSEKYMDENPDVLLSLMYFKAKALWGLNKNNEAIELMSEIVKQQPDFKSADLTLSQWKEVA